jgi:hypothetical protein
MRSGPELVQTAIMGVLSHIPSTREPHDVHPVARARAVAKAAALKTATVSGSLSLPPGPVGWLTIIPDLTMVWKIQSQIVADIAGAFGKESSLGQEQMLYCLFRHAAAHSMRGVLVRAGERVLIKQAPAHALEVAVRKIGIPVARRVAGRGLSRWLPLIGAAGVAGYAYFDTMRVAATTIELFRSEDPERRDVVAPVAAQIAGVGADLRGPAAKIAVLEDPHLAADDPDR